MNNFQRIPKTIMICVLLPLLQTACASERENKAPRSDVLSEQKARQSKGLKQHEFRITIARGGGMTGSYRGYTLFSDGTIEHWQRFSVQEQTTLWSAKVMPDQIEALRKQLEQSGMLGTIQQETGNMTITASYELSDTSYVWSWNANSAEHIPPELKRWYEAINGFCHQVQQESKKTRSDSD